MKLFLGTIAACLGLAGLSAEASTPQTSTRETGRLIAKQRCATCHAITLSDDSPHKQAPRFRDIAARYDVSVLAEALAEGITVGHRDMPQFVLDVDEIAALLDYLASLGPNTGRRPPRRP